MTEEQLPQPSSRDQDPSPSLGEQLRETTIQKAVIISDESSSDSTQETGEVTSPAPAKPEDSTSQSASTPLRSSSVVNPLDIRQFDEDIDLEGNQDEVAQNTDWFTLARKLRQHNRELVKTVVQLEQSLADAQEALQTQMMRSRSTETLISQQGEELNNTQEQVSRLFNELETTHQTTQRQQTLIEDLTEQLNSAQAKHLQLESEYNSLQEAYNEQSQKLISAEKEIREMRSRLHRQQRQSLQYKAALDQFLELPKGVQDKLDENRRSGILEDLTQASVQAEPEFELDSLPSSQVTALMPESQSLTIAPPVAQAESQPIPPSQPSSEKSANDESGSYQLHHPQPIQPWSSEVQEMPVPFKLKIVPDPSSKTQTPATVSETVSSSEPDKSASLETEVVSDAESEFSSSHQELPKPESQNQELKSTTLPFYHSPSRPSSFPSFNLKRSNLEPSPIPQDSTVESLTAPVSPEKVELEEHLEPESGQAQAMESPNPDVSTSEEIPDLESTPTPATKPHLRLPLEFPLGSSFTPPSRHPLAEEEDSETPRSVSQRLATPSPLISPLRSQKSPKKSTRRLHLPTFPQYHSL